MTEKLYYLDAYIKEFEATVLESYEDKGRYAVVLDRTAFSPKKAGNLQIRASLARLSSLTSRKGTE